jgi:hypothetical protein
VSCPTTPELVMEVVNVVTNTITVIALAYIAAIQRRNHRG